MLNQIKQLLKISETRKNKILDTVKSYTMIDQVRLNQLLLLATEIRTLEIKGDVVECGVCNGGSAAVFAHIIRDCENKKLWLYDTFDGIPAPQNIDGKLAFEYTGKLKGDLEKVRTILKEISFPLDRVVFRVGNFSNTFKLDLPDRISLLHIDADWYESVLLALNTLYPRVVNGGVIILDDFGHWEGTREAFFDFCKNEDIKPLLERVGYTQAYWRKGRLNNR